MKSSFAGISYSGLSVLSVLLVLAIRDIVAVGFSFLLIVKVVVYFVCLVLSIATIVFPDKHLFYYLGLSILCVYDVFKGSEITSLLFLVILVNLLILCNFYNTNTILKVILTSVFWGILFCCLCVSSHVDYDRIIYFFGISVFGTGSFYTIYELNRRHRQSPKVEIPPKININEINDNNDCNDDNDSNGLYNFSKRQLYCLRDTVEKISPYKVIAEQLNTSESTIKKEFSVLYKLYNVEDRKELKNLITDDDGFFSLISTVEEES